MAARVASPLPAAGNRTDRYLSLLTPPSTPPNSLRLSIPYLQSLHPLPAHLPSLPGKPKVKRSTIERGLYHSRSIGKPKTEINVSVIAVSSPEDPPTTRGKCRHCAKCANALAARARIASPTRRPLFFDGYSGLQEEEHPIERKAARALDTLLQGYGEVSNDDHSWAEGSCSWSTTSTIIRTPEATAAPSPAFTPRPRRPVCRQTTSIPLSAAPLTPSSSIDDLPPAPTQLPRVPTKRPPMLTSTPPNRTITNRPHTNRPHTTKHKPIPSSVQLTTFSMSPIPPPLRLSYSSPLSGSIRERGILPQPRRKSCPQTPLRIQVIEWRMVQCGKLAGVRLRGAAGDGTAGRWDGS